MICWCSTLICLIVFEIVDWIRHYDKSGKIKYEFYQTFLYNGKNEKSEEEKRELIREFRMLTKNKWQKFLMKLVTPHCFDKDDGKEDAVTALAGAAADFLMVCIKNHCELVVFVMNLLELLSHYI